MKMLGLCNLNLATRMNDIGQRWKYRPVQDYLKNRSRTSDGGIGYDIRRQLYNAFAAICSSRIYTRLALTLLILLLWANLAKMHRLGLLGKFSAPECYPNSDLQRLGNIDWHRFAYCQYVSNPEDLCNALMIFESLKRLGSKADRLMMYPEDWKVVADRTSLEYQLFTKARDEYNVTLQPMHVQHMVGDATWADTKLLAFNQTQYHRVLSLDSDSTVLQAMDELFLLPEAAVAMPRAYWLDDHSFSTQLVLFQPSKFEFNRILDAFSHRKVGEFDTEIINRLYAKDCMVIPHRRYELLTSEFRSEQHSRYLGSTEEKWDAQKVLDEAKFLHFSDWPFPKPWLPGPVDVRLQLQPACKEKSLESDCIERTIWNDAYADFKLRRSKICKSSS